MKNKININNQELINLKKQFNYLKNAPHNIININNINNINNRNYYNKNNHIINKRYKKPQNNRSLIVKNKNDTIVSYNHISNNIPKIIGKKYKIINNKNSKNMYSQINNNSLPNVEKFEKKNNVKKYIINNGLKTNVINNKGNNLSVIPKIENKDYNNNFMPKIYQKYLNDSKKEEYEKQKIDEVKILLDKIVSDFES